MKRIIQKLKSSAGLSLGETLLALAILLLGMSIVAAGMPAAVSAYRNAIDAANAQVLLSATVNALRSELSTARDVKQPTENEITYYSTETGSRSKLYQDADAEGCKLMLREYDDRRDDAFFLQGETLTQAEARPLVSNEMTRTTKNKEDLMTVSCTGIALSDDGKTVTVEGLQIMRDTTVLAEVPSDSSLTIRVLSGGAGA